MTQFSGADRRQWWGYTDIGPVQIPAAPYYIVLTDRADGITLWYLTFDTTQYPFPDGYGLVAISTTVPKIGGGYAANLLTFTPYNEPYIGNMPTGYTGQLFVRSGDLGLNIQAENDPEYAPIQGTSNQANFGVFALPQNALVGFGNPSRQLIFSKGSLRPISGFVAWIPWDVTQTPNPAPVVSNPPFSNTVDV